MKNHQTKNTNTHSQLEFTYVVGRVLQTKPAGTQKTTERPIIKKVKSIQQPKHVSEQFEFVFFRV